MEQLRDPVQGPIAGIVPVVTMLLGTALLDLAPVAARIVVALGIAAAAVFAAWLLSVWISGERPVDAVHGAYFLPTVAAGFIAEEGAAEAGWHEVALGAFAVAALFWVVIQTALLLRLAVRPPLPGPLTPTLAIMVAPPAVGVLAWSAIHGGRLDELDAALTGVLVLMLLVQLALLPRYLRLRFSLGFWSFTFPLAAAGTVGIEWATHAAAPVSAAVVLVILAGVTALVLWVGVRSLGLVLRDRAAGRPDAELTLDTADAAADAG